MNLAYTPTDLDRMGKESYKKGKFPEAAGYFKAAAEGFQAAGDPLSSAEMANNASVAYLKAGDYQAALEAVEGTEGIFNSAGDMRRRAMAIGNQAAALESLNRIDEAILMYEQADNLFKEIGEHELRAPILQSLSTLQFKSGRSLEGLANLNAGFEEGGNSNLRRRILKAFTDLPIKFLTKSK
jgi:tetratricopeptide (TPR) repeat protein